MTDKKLFNNEQIMNIKDLVELEIEDLEKEIQAIEVNGNYDKENLNLLYSQKSKLDAILLLLKIESKVRKRNEKDGVK